MAVAPGTTTVDLNEDEMEATIQDTALDKKLLFNNVIKKDNEPLQSPNPRN